MTTSEELDMMIPEEIAERIFRDYEEIVRIEKLPKPKQKIDKRELNSFLILLDFFNRWNRKEITGDEFASAFYNHFKKPIMKYLEAIRKEKERR